MERTLYDLVYRLVMFNSHRKRKVQMDYHIYFEPSPDYSILEIEERAKELHELMKNDVGKKFGLVIEKLERKKDLPRKMEIQKEDSDLIFTDAGVILKNKNVYKI